MRRQLLTLILLIINCISLSAQTTKGLAPGAPGADARWSGAAKNGFGTSNTLSSKVWFTLAGGVMTEVYYPTIDVPNTQMLQLIIVSGDRKKIETEQEDTTHEIKILDARALTFQQINKSKNSDYFIRKTYTVDPSRETVLIQVQFETRHNYPYFVYVYYDPSLNNSGMHDSAWTEGDALLSLEDDKASALIAIRGFDQTTNGYSGASDGLTQLRRGGKITEAFAQATNGNVVQVAQLEPSAPLTLALGFGKTTAEALQNARASLAQGFDRTRREYEAGWHRYVSTLPRVEPKYQRQFNMAAMVLKALEDKTYRGATIASPSVPWGGGANANEPNISGYHAVWARDLYQVATAFHALGDSAAANRALDYLFQVQQRPDGSFPQNSWVDGRSIGNGLQMDEVALPLVLSYQLGRTDRQTWRKHIKPAADYLASKGPYTGQDRWEEKPGYSPATIAAEIAGLVCAARIATINRDHVYSEKLLKKADEWAAKVELWTATKTGPNTDRRYFLRITKNGDPNDGAKIEINSGGGSYDQREIVDAGFLELVRLGIRPADDPLIVSSLAVVDKLIKVETENGPAWYRYNHDAYGEGADGGPYDGRTGVGRLWTLLTGERGEYELARRNVVKARRSLDAMVAFANDGLMIPEQVWDREQSPRAEFHFGEGTGAATPLAWSMAQFIRLATNIKRGRNFDTPRVVADRYVKGSGKENDQFKR